MIAIVDYGMGNLSSVAKAFESLNVEASVTSDAGVIRRAERIVLPGVGAFGEGMKHLERLGLRPVLEEAVRVQRKPFLGICLGMQLMAKDSQEHGHHQGLGWIDGTVQPFAARHRDVTSLHIGWAPVSPRPADPLFANLGAAPQFYFVHGYHLACRSDRAVSAYAVHGDRFTAAIRQDNLLGVQFHPEKSQETGLGLLRNFVRWNPADTRTATSEWTDGVVCPAANIRLIPTLLLHRGRMVKTVRFQLIGDGLRRDVGDPVKAPMVYDAQLADELVYLDIRATVEERRIFDLQKAIASISGQVFMPLTVGGGISTPDEIRILLQSGADKVAINSAAVARPAFITEAARHFGNQCIVVSIDVRRNTAGRDEVYTRSGTQPTGLDPVVWAQQAEAAGSGEILLTSIDRDGTMQGYDLELIRRVASAVHVPVIASGGAGTTQDLVSVMQEGGASAAAAASLFHFRDVSPIKAKSALRRAGLLVRQ